MPARSSLRLRRERKYIADTEAPPWSCRPFTVPGIIDTNAKAAKDCQQVATSTHPTIQALGNWMMTLSCGRAAAFHEIQGPGMTLAIASSFRRACVGLRFAPSSSYVRPCVAAADRCSELPLSFLSSSLFSHRFTMMVLFSASHDDSLFSHTQEQ